MGQAAGKAAENPGIAFGEGVLWRRRPIGGALGTLSITWEGGVFVGAQGRACAIIIGDGKETWKTRTIQRTPSA